MQLLTWFFVHPGERFHYTQLSKSMTVEHAREKANVSEVSFLQMEKVVA
ncbi:MAG: hypothetical protein ACYC6T_16120 [Thermoleophilia bacterium]